MSQFPRLSFLALLFLALLSTVRADDLADAKSAFEGLYQYQKTDDPRTLELFAPDVAVTMLLTYGDEVRPTYLPRAQFFGTLQHELSLKKGTRDLYEATKYTQEGTNVRVSSTLVDGATGKRGPINLLYVRNAQGELKIKELRITVHSPGPLPPLF